MRRNIQGEKNMGYGLCQRISTDKKMTASGTVIHSIDLKNPKSTNMLNQNNTNYKCIKKIKSTARIAITRI